MTERTRLISYLLYGLFSAILKKNTIKTPEVIFHIRLRALWLSSSLILKKYLYASFSFSYRKYSCTLSILCFRSRAISFYSQLKRVVEPRKIFIMPGHDLRKSCPLSRQSEPAYYCIHIIKHGNDCQWEPYYINLRDEYQKIVYSCKRKSYLVKAFTND